MPEQLKLEFYHTVFEIPSGTHSLPPKFAIITAYPPPGRKWIEKKNEEADEHLEGRLKRWSPFRVVGKSPDGRHAEPGWGATCSEATARVIGRQYLQHAIFWIEGDDLWIANALGGPKEFLGSFRKRIVP